ncbi:hypothetical protein FH103_01955 [Staphylococcus hominis]|uniref:hypothetical protein n=1 Tax=Staphylococcus hominis TaxID=1290 RepID=UPI001F599F1F|nr:hypothetical protein [Staphylococcus hominis]MCI2881409.1 hypothetical protein [Staphylococcus hominis]
MNEEIKPPQTTHGSEQNEAITKDGIRADVIITRYTKQGGVTMLKKLKIALLIVILAEEIRNAMGETKYNYDSINGKWKRKGKAQKFS